ncbi:MAG: HAMP domain-containing sensor histidine kinase [Chloroflexota bacterium]
MDLGRPALRIFAFIAVVALPALAALALVLVLGDAWVAEVGVSVVLLVVGLGTLLWAAIVAAVGSRSVTRDLQGVVTLAERGAATGAESGLAEEEGELSAAQRRLRMALEERNQQISILAADVAATPITGGPAEVASRVVTVARQVTRDPTWLLVVLQAGDPGLLPSGVYDGDPDSPPRPLGELERWAAVSGEADRRGPRHLIGPWGAVVAVEASGGEELNALLLAPWEGRPEPTPAERDLLSLIAQIASTAIEHSLLYARLRAQTDELNRMAAVQSDFLRGITHDLQTPLTSIRALAAEVGATEDLGASAQRDLATIAHQSDRMRRMVGQLLAVSRLEAGALESRQEIFRAEPIVQRTWDALRDANHRFAFRSEGEPHLVVGDPDRYEQVLWALLDNATKYAPPGTEVGVAVTGQAGTDGKLLSELAVTDQGPGMSPADQARAFDQFFRGDDARKMVPNGSGIGLYAARGLVEAMHGHLELESASGAGTTFRVTLPAERAEPEAGE